MNVCRGINSLNSSYVVDNFIIVMYQLQYVRKIKIKTKTASV